MKIIAVVLSIFALASIGNAQSVKELQSEIAALQATVAELQQGVAQVTSVNTAQSTAAAALQHQVNLIASNPALALGPFVSINTVPTYQGYGPTIVFTGANVQIVSGSGMTNDSSGKGNLILGYNVSPVLNSWGIGNRSGSHDLIIGDQHWYAGSGNIVSGLHNSVDGWGEVVFGNYNQAANTGSIILGGTQQTQFQNYTTVLGTTVVQ
jgi:trimeric autotransporter adhesin